MRPFPFFARSIPLALVLACAAVPVASCSDPYAHFTTRFASDFAPAPHTLSVFGIFRDGRMSNDTWDELGPALSGAFASGACQAAYSDDLVEKNQPLSSAVDDYVRANGVSDELLDVLAPAATGDLVLVYTIAGRVGAGPDGGMINTGAMPMQSPNAAAVRNPRYRGVPPTPGAGYGSMRSFGGNANALEVSASLYSVSLHRSVALVEMSYLGSSLDDALAQLTTKLRASFPGSTCGAWNWSVKVDDQKVRALVEH
jgi:hypothetical protein